MNRTLLILPALAALALPGVSFAQTQTQSITVNGTVAPACVLGAPANATLSLGALTGADGRLTTALAGSGIAASTTIANAWCNTPNRITLTSSPLTLTTNPTTLPDNFTRTVAFQAALNGWSGPVVNKALTANFGVPVDSTVPHVAAPLTVEFSNLSPVVGGVAAQATDFFIEAGVYSATVSITLAVN